MSDLAKPWGSSKAILHADLDCFFAAVEILDNPSLVGKPVIVGGSGPRRVVASANYQARVYGVHSAMPMAIARRICPNAVIVDGRHSRYTEFSNEFQKILGTFTDEIEPIGLDEAFMDVSGASMLFGHPIKISEQIRRTVFESLSLSVCIGVGTTKQIAKLASRRAKPAVSNGKVIQGPGIYVVWPGEESDFLGPLSVGELWGVGAKTLEKLNGIGIRTVSDLREVPPKSLLKLLGKSGQKLHQLAMGIDGDRVTSRHVRKSIGREKTYSIDLFSQDNISGELVRICDSVAGSLNQKGIGTRTITLKVRFGNFQTLTRSVTLAQPTNSQAEIIKHVRMLTSQISFDQGVRLLGVSLSNLSETKSVQLTLDGLENDTRQVSLTQAMTKIRERFGNDSLAPASLLKSGKLDMIRGHENQWGPNHPGQDL